MRKILVNILAIIFTIFSVIGNSFMFSDSFLFIYQDVWHILGNIALTGIIFVVIKFLLNALFKYFDKNSGTDLKVNKFTKFFTEHPFITSFIIITICWLPYFISFYPCILSPDPSFQIKQFFGIPNKYSTYVVLLDESQIITNHHPVLHTLLLGSCLKVGHLMHNDNLGLFIYIVIQSLVFISTLAYTVGYLKKIGLNTKYLFIVLLIYALVPVFPMYTITCVKDVFFGCYIILFSSYLHLLLKDKLKWYQVIIIGLLALLMSISRNNGIYVVILTLVPLLFIKFNLKKYIILSLVLSIMTYYGYDKVVLPYFKVTPTSVREALSIPFQQTARYVRDHEDLVTDDEKEIYDYLLRYDDLGTRYNSEKSDPVKNEFNRFATKNDLKIYFSYWFKDFFKAPITYIEATISNIYGYFYPVKTNWYVYYKEMNIINEDGFNYHYNNLTVGRNVLSLTAQAFPYIPVLGMLVNIGFNVWLLMIFSTYLIINKKYKYILFMVPYGVLILVCVASPVNCYFRYALPFVFALPLNYGIFKSINKCDNIRKVS